MTGQHNLSELKKSPASGTSGPGPARGRRNKARNHSKGLLVTLKEYAARRLLLAKRTAAGFFAAVSKNTRGFFSGLVTGLSGFFKAVSRGLSRVFASGLLMGVSILYHKAKRQLKKNSLEIFRFVERSSRLWLPIGVLVLLVSIFLSANTYCIALKVIVDGEMLGYVHGQDDYEKARVGAENSIAAMVGNQYLLDKEPQYEFAIVKREDITDIKKIEGELTKTAQEDLDQTYGLYLDGELVAVNESQDDLVDLLDAIKEPYLSDITGETAEFIKTVEIKKDVYPKNLLRDIDEIRGMLMISEDSVTYTVKAGDTASGIADKFSLSLASLKTLNKGVNVNKIKPGQKLKIGNAGTVLGVKVVRTIKYNEVIDYSTETQKTSSLYKGEQKVKNPGSKGTREITATVTLVDGEETERVINSKRVVKAPVNRVVLVGTKSVAPSGTFRWPVGGTGGTITSTFYDRRGSRRHNAIDIAAHRGTPILAADGGTVYSVSYSGSGYGNQVVIDHGNGVRTRYAHCSKILVKKGQKVPKGYKIATMGSTGWSTGPHLHFEIMKVKGGSVTFVNPLTLVGKK